jgi:hypothetical protein
MVATTAALSVELGASVTQGVSPGWQATGASDGAKLMV